MLPYWYHAPRISTMKISVQMHRCLLVRTQQSVGMISKATIAPGMSNEDVSQHTSVLLGMRVVKRTLRQPAVVAAEASMARIASGRSASLILGRLILVG
mmetsp:Transcript_96080/g.271729  ORF Transcript_96080/g.271729 Transcript_96080/m.271729 type:complete len:99 (+) Transcript_96080:68-364(+)